MTDQDQFSTVSENYGPGVAAPAEQESARHDAPAADPTAADTTAADPVTPRSRIDAPVADAATEQLPHGAPPAAGSPGPPSSSESATGTALFADDEWGGLRARWDAVQVSFVDDPEGSVHKADGLVSDVLQQLTAGFANARTRLEGQWGRGEQASTEDLRVALQNYREFFQRLLAV